MGWLVLPSAPDGGPGVGSGARGVRWLLREDQYATERDRLLVASPPVKVRHFWRVREWPASSRVIFRVRASSGTVGSQSALPWGIDALDVRDGMTMRTLLALLIDESGANSYREFRRQYEATGNKLEIVNATVSKRTYERWYSGDCKPGVDARRILQALFDHSIEELIAPAPEVTRPLPASPFTDPGPAPAGLVDMGRQAAMAADRALRFAVLAETGSIGPETLDHIRTEVARLAAAYPRVPLDVVLGDLIEVQDLAFRLLESGRTKPAQARDLYFLASMASGMLAKASHDLGDPRSAMAQARSAYVCADQADHQPMRAWVRGLQSLISYWAGSPDEAVRFSQRGNAEAARVTGTSGAWLASLEARAQAQLGNEQGVIEAISRATDLREAAVPDELDLIGGILTFPRPRQLYYTAEAQVLLDVPSARAARDAKAAVDAYRSAQETEWAYGDEAGAHTNLALTRIANGDLDGAVDEIHAVLDLPAAQRSHGIVVSVKRVHRALTAPPVRMAEPARDMRAEIELFTNNPIPALPR